MPRKALNPRKPSPAPKRVAKPKAERTKKNNPPAASISIAQLDADRAAFDSHFAPYIISLPPEATAFGRPTIYRPEFCAQVIHYASLGHTIGATAAFLGVSREAMKEWEAVHPDFGRASARAKTIRQAFYEGHLIDIARRGGDSTRMSAIKLGLLNVGGEDWKERLTAEHNVTFSWANLLKETLEQAAPAKQITLDLEPNKPSPDDDAAN